MPILNQTAQRTLSGRLTVALLYTVLVVGGMTMVVPFVMTLGDSFRTPGDDDDHGLFPGFFTDDAWLFRKYVCVKHGELSGYHRHHPGTDYTESRQIPFPAVDNGDRVSARDYSEWIHESVRHQPTWFTALFLGRGGADSVQMWDVAGRYLEFLRSRYATITELNRAYGTEYSTFNHVLHPREQADIPTWAVRPQNRYLWDWQEFKQQLPPELLFPVSMHYRYQLFLRTQLETLDRVNAVLGSHCAALEQVRLPTAAPDSPEHRRLWCEFVADRLPPRFFDWSPETRAAWSTFLEQRFGSPARFLEFRNREMAKVGLRSAAADEPLVPGEPTGARSVDRLFGDFIRDLDPTALRLCLPETSYRNHLRQRYASIAELNAAYGADHSAFDQFDYPAVAADRVDFEQRRPAIFREALKRNYAIVLNYLVLNGRSAWVTLLLCLASVGCALVVNPLAAYALSRYDLKIGYQVLIFFLATMAFPAEVSMIPNFLMLKQLGMLNTLWALFLPTAANGYSIFILKGFFDSMPKELFEAADIDGAGELTIFLRLVIPCSTPVLAVIALGAFTAAYGSFMWAFVVCQDPDWWTIMVYMFKLSNSGVHSGVRVAALVVTSLPTFLVFVFCQNIILRGIVVPQMK